jgi:class 3 adenylate cyclase/alpha-beta hydrolase superfamily lysophospholipase
MGSRPLAVRHPAPETSAVETPEVRYARSGAVNIAYQVVGEGPVDLLYIPGWISHLDLYWEEPGVSRFLRRLGTGVRLILFDRRGTGLSDRVPEDTLPTLEGQLDDARAVLDAAGSERAAIFAQGYGCPLGIIFAATHPDRTRALVLYNAIAKAGPRTDDYPWGRPPDGADALRATYEERWGSDDYAREWLGRLAPSAADDPRQVAWNARLMRASATPSAAVRFAEMTSLMDVRELLALLHVPTLVLQRQDVVAPKGSVDVHSLEEAEWVASRIPGAKLVVVPGRDYLPWVGDQEALVDEVASFAIGSRPVAEPDRVLLTVLFTDVVDSTGWLARLGDRRWRELLGEHDIVVRRELERFRGREVDQAGDGFFATFDGPARAIRCAREIAGEAQRLGLEIRAGVHTGECELAGERVTGIAVHIGARIAALAGPGEVLVSSTVKDLVAGSELRFEERPPTPLKGVPGEWRLHALLGTSR